MTKFEVFWDGYGLNRPGSGVYHAAQNLAQETMRLGYQPTIIKSKSDANVIKSLHHCDLASYGIFDRIMKSKLIWTARVKSYLLRKNLAHKTNILHGLSNFNIPLGMEKLPNFKSVLTIHDLIPFLAKGQTSRLYFYQMRYYLPKIVNSAHRIICVSHWTKHTLTSFFPQTHPKIEVIYNGFPEFVGTRSKLRNQGKDNITDILSVSRMEKYKRFDFLAEILRHSSHKLRLTLVTNDRGGYWAREHFKDLINTGALIVKTALTPCELKHEYLNTDVYVHTSLYEGFCLPASEAMACGKPVVYQSGSAIDETVGSKVGFGMRLNDSPQKWEQTILKASIISKKERFYDEIKGIVKSKNSWTQSAKDVVALYENLAKTT